MCRYQSLIKVLQKLTALELDVLDNSLSVKFKNNNLQEMPLLIDMDMQLGQVERVHVLSLFYINAFTKYQINNENLSIGFNQLLPEPKEPIEVIQVFYELLRSKGFFS